MGMLNSYLKLPEGKSKNQPASIKGLMILMIFPFLMSKWNIAWNDRLIFLRKWCWWRKWRDLVVLYRNRDEVEATSTNSMDPFPGSFDTPPETLVWYWIHTNEQFPIYPWFSQLETFVCRGLTWPAIFCCGEGARYPQDFIQPEIRSEPGRPPLRLRNHVPREGTWVISAAGMGI